MNNEVLLGEHFRVMGRTKFYVSISEMQTDLDAYLVTYDTRRPHQGRGMNGRTPADVFARCLPKTKKPKEGMGWTPSRQRSVALREGWHGSSVDHKVPKGKTSCLPKATGGSDDEE